MTVSSPMDDLALDQEFCASPAQLRELQAGSAFVRAQVLTLLGAVDTEALARSLLRLRRRHEVLRTVLRKKDGAWYQLVLHSATEMGMETEAGLARGPLSLHDLEYHDYADQPAKTTPAALQALLQPLAQACLSEAGPLFRMALVRASPHHHACLLAASSLVLDSFSFELLLGELRSLYAAEVLAPGSPVPEPELQYADCVLWEQAMSGARPVAAAETARAAAEDPPRASAYSRGAAWHDQPLGPDVAARLRDAGAHVGALLLAAASAASAPLMTQSSLEPAGFGLLTAGRTSPELEHTLGPFQRTSAIEIALPHGTPIAALVTEAEKAIHRARGSARFGTLALLPPSSLLLVDGPLTLSSPFAQGVQACWENPGSLAPAGPASGAGTDFAVRVLLSGPGDNPSTTRLGIWSWSLPQQHLEQLSERLAAALEHLVLHPDEPLPTLAVRQLATPLAMQEPDSDIRAAAPAPAAAPVYQQAAGSEAPQGEVETTLAAIWSTVLQVPFVGRHEDFFDLGGHSLLAVRIGTRIENAFGKEIPLNAILEKPTIAEFARLIGETSAADAQGDPPELRRHRLVPIQEPNVQLTARTPLFWIPGGRAISVLALREVSLLLGPDRPVYGVESRLPEQGEGFLSVPVRAGQYVDLLRERQPHGPYLLAGFCVGGMVAFEMAQQLRQQGEEVGFLGLLQASMPGFPANLKLRRKMERQRQLYLARTMLSFLLLRVSPWHRKRPREAQQVILDRFAKLLTGWVGTSSQLPETTQQSNGQTMKSYRPTTYPGAVHIFLAQDCFESAGMEPALDPRRAWTSVAGGGAEIVFVPGDHVSMLTQGPARALAEAMRAVLPS